MQKKIAAEAAISTQVWKAMKKPAHVGDIRVVERAYLIPPNSSDDPVWVKRMSDYWMLQERTYGLKMTHFTMVVDPERGTVRSYSGIMAILPGKRLVDYEYDDWKRSPEGKAWHGHGHDANAMVTV